jgi:hypothetical protein
LGELDDKGYVRRKHGCGGTFSDGSALFDRDEAAAFNNHLITAQAVIDEAAVTGVGHRLPPDARIRLRRKVANRSRIAGSRSTTLARFSFRFFRKSNIARVEGTSSPLSSILRPPENLMMQDLALDLIMGVASLFIGFVSEFRFDQEIQP